MQWDDLRYVLALKRRSTLSAAARSLGVNHTTVARRVAALEEEISARLFDKTPQGYAPTQAGEDILEVARRMESEMASLDRHVLGKDTRLSGPLRVTTVDIMATQHAAEIAAFTRRYPDVQLEVSVDNSMRSLTKREADVALRITNSPAENLVGRRLGRLEFALYGADALIEVQNDPTDLTCYPWLGWDERLGAKLTERWMQKHVPRARVVCRFDTSVTMFEAVRQGMGLSFLGCLWADRTPGLRRIRGVEPGFGMDLWLLTHPDLRNTARVRAFMDHMGEAMRPSADAMAGRMVCAEPVTGANHDG
jgi:DNA-binding transcriptional LysR family regulator